MAGRDWDEGSEETSLVWRLLGLALIIGSAALVGFAFAHAANYLSWVIAQ